MGFIPPSETAYKAENYLRMMKAYGISEADVLLYSVGIRKGFPAVDPKERFLFFIPYKCGRKQFLLLTATGERFAYRLGWAGYTLPEIAEAFGTSVSVLKNEINRARFERAVRAGRYDGSYYSVKQTAKLNASPDGIGRLDYLNIRFSHAPLEFCAAVSCPYDMEQDFLKRKQRPPRKKKPHAHPEQWNAGEWVPTRSTTKKHRRRSKYDGHVQTARRIQREPMVPGSPSGEASAASV